MSWATPIIAELIQGKTVEFNPVGNSMEPELKSGQRVRVAPLGNRALRKGDIVLVKVDGTVVLHYISNMKKGQIEIRNGKGHINGWTPVENVYGILTEKL